MKDTLTTHQQKVFEAITRDIKGNLFSFSKSDNIEDRILSLTGAAGTGKSFLTAQIAKTIDKDLKELNYYYNDSLCITAPTHQAVKVLKEMMLQNQMETNCRTIHSFLGIKLMSDYETGEEKFAVDKMVRNPLTASLLIIDESSMVSKELYEFILASVKEGKLTLFYLSVTLFNFYQ